VNKTSNSVESINQTLQQHQEYIEALEHFVQESKGNNWAEPSVVSDARIQSLNQSLSSIEASILEEAFTIAINDSKLCDQLPYSKEFLQSARAITREIFDCEN
jgi:prefoldin subunit 5